MITSFIFKVLDTYGYLWIPTVGRKFLSYNRHKRLYGYLDTYKEDIIIIIITPYNERDFTRRNQTEGKKLLPFFVGSGIQVSRQEQSPIKSKKIPAYHRYPLKYPVSKTSQVNHFFKQEEKRNGKNVGVIEKDCVRR